jgi:hypothetical protein
VAVWLPADDPEPGLAVRVCGVWCPGPGLVPGVAGEWVTNLICLSKQVDLEATAHVSAAVIAAIAGRRFAVSLGAYC